MRRQTVERSKATASLKSYVRVTASGGHASFASATVEHRLPRHLNLTDGGRQTDGELEADERKMEVCGGRLRGTQREMKLHTKRRKGGVLFSTVSEQKHPACH